MTDENILEIAGRHGHSFLYGDCWEFEKDSLLGFARALMGERLIEDAERKHEYISNEAYDCMGREALP